MDQSDTSVSKTLFIYKVNVTNTKVSKVKIKPILSNRIALHYLHQGVNFPKVDEKLQGA